MKEEIKKPKSKWRPKKFCKSVTVDSKTGKVIKREFVTAKSPEEEKEWERDIAERWIECQKILWGDKFDWFTRSITHLMDKYGEKEFIRGWNKAGRELKREEKNKNT